MSPEEILIWRIPLEIEDRELAAFERMLAADERQRADRLRVASARRQLIVTSVQTRRILSELVFADANRAGEIRFVKGPHGKPALAPDLLASGQSVEFNLSHSHEHALFAASRGPAVGIDLEKINEKRDFTGLAKRFFAPEETRAIDETSRTSGRDEARLLFFRLWTCKEALVKGQGIALDAVTMKDPAIPLHPSAFPWSGQVSNGWWLQELEVLEGYAAALATPSGARTKLASLP